VTRSDGVCLDGRDGEAGYMTPVVLGSMGRRPIAQPTSHTVARIEF